MGNVGGGGYTYGSNTFESLLAKLSIKYKANENGKFGAKGKGRVRVLETANPANAALDFFRTFSAAGSVSELDSGNGSKITFPNSKALIIYRASSKSGGPVIEISTNNMLDQKIHFVPRKN